MTPEEQMKVHQYLYYVLARPIISDYEYDLFCKKHGLEGGGGSDNPLHYPRDIRLAAEKAIQSGKVP